MMPILMMVGLWVEPKSRNCCYELYKLLGYTATRCCSWLKDSWWCFGYSV